MTNAEKVKKMEELFNSLTCADYDEICDDDDYDYYDFGPLTIRIYSNGLVYWED